MHTTTKYFKYQSQIPIANIVVTRLVKSENQKIANLYLKNKFKTDYIDGSLMEINKVTQQDFETRYCVGLRKAVKLFIDGNFAKTKTLKDCEVNGDQIYAIIKAHLTPFLKIELGHISTLWYPNDIRKWLERFFYKRTYILPTLFQESTANVKGYTTDAESMEHLVDDIMSVVKDQLEEEINLEVKAISRPL